MARQIFTAAFLRAARREKLPLAVYRKLVADLYANSVSIASTCTCVLIGALVPYARTGRSVFLLCFAACLSAAILRCCVVVLYRKANHGSDSRQKTAAWEAAYALLCSWPFMLGLGVNAAFAILSSDVISAMFGLLIVCAAVGSIAGRSASRARTTGQGAIIFAAFPVLAAMLATRDPYMVVLAAMTLAHDMALVSHSKTIQRSIRDGHVGHATIERLAAKLRQLALHDELTGLFNRAAFRDALTSACSAGKAFDLILVDLDRFKAVNDTLGHPAGDALLRQVSERIRNCVFDGNIVARLGGDEFAILIPKLDDAGSSVVVAKRVVEAVGSSFQLGQHEVSIGASIGLASGGDDGVEPDTLMQNADLALYAAKAAGKGTIRRYESEMDPAATRPAGSALHVALNGECNRELLAPAA